MIGHGKEICACGAVIQQCRCIQGHGAPRVVCQTCPQCLAATAAAIAAFEPSPDEAEKELAKLMSTYEASEEVYLRAKARYLGSGRRTDPCPTERHRRKRPCKSESYSHGMRSCASFAITCERRGSIR